MPDYRNRSALAQDYGKRIEEPMKAVVKPAAGQRAPAKRAPLRGQATPVKPVELSQMRETSRSYPTPPPERLQNVFKESGMKSTEPEQYRKQETPENMYNKPMQKGAEPIVREGVSPEVNIPDAFQDVRTQQPSIEGSQPRAYTGFATMPPVATMPDQLRRQEALKRNLRVKQTPQYF